MQLLCDPRVHQLWHESAQEKFPGETFAADSASESPMMSNNREIFDEDYRVIAVDTQNLVVQGVRTGRVLTIINHNPAAPLTPEDYPPGGLIALSDPCSGPYN